MHDELNAIQTLAVRDGVAQSSHMLFYILCLSMVIQICMHSSRTSENVCSVLKYSSDTDCPIQAGS